MLFWRTKSAKQAADNKLAKAETDEADQQSSAFDEELGDGDEPGQSPPAAIAATDGNSENSNDVASAVAVTTSVPVISEIKMVSISPAPSRLSDRLADVSPMKPAAKAAAERAAQHEIIQPAGSTSAPGQSKALAALRSALAIRGSGSHVLVMGRAGTGRRASAEVIALEIAQSMSRACDWVFTADASDAARLTPHALSAGAGVRIGRDMRDAFAKSSAMLARMIAGDHHQMALSLLEEDHRHRNDAPFETLKRRAEAQNIALVKTTEGYMLAPMHEGKVVRADVFRALPEALQRDVEAKVTALEAELHQLMGSLPSNDIATDDRHIALAQQTAERAVKPNMATVRKLSSTDADGAAFFDALEAQWTRQAVEYVRLGTDVRTLPAPTLLPVASPYHDRAPVVVAHSISAAALLGEIGRDASGALAVRPGALMQANGGFLIADAWRFAADPQAWSALASALEVGGVAPLSCPGLAVTADPIPLGFKLVLIAERESFAKLQSIDPRFGQHFGTVVGFEETATAFDVTEADFAEWAAALASALALRQLKSAVAPVLYDDARSRAGDRSRVSIDIASLVHTLRAADAAASEDGRDAIGVADIEAALLRRAALQGAGAAA